MNFVMKNQAFYSVQRWLKPVACGLLFIAEINASWGTAIMEFMALNLGSGDHATIP